MNNSINKRRAKVYRFKFSNELKEYMCEFARIHKYDDRQEFKENFMEWKKKYKNEIENENERWLNLGYEKDDIVDKIFKSIKYYYSKPKKEASEKSEYKRDYVKLPDNLIKSIKLFIDNIIEKKNIIKPSKMYDLFMEDYEDGENIIERYGDRYKEKIKKSIKNYYHKKRTE